MADKLVLDLETQKSFDEVEGRNTALLKISVAGVYRYATDEYLTFLESEVTALEALLKSAELLIGFNIRRFDLEVLAPYVTTPIDRFPVLDLMEEVAKHLGHRVSLESLAQATLGEGKSGTGLEALRLFREGRMDELKRYCLDDVRLTRDLYEYGKAHGELICRSKLGDRPLIIPVSWQERNPRIVQLLELASQRHLQVELLYRSPGEPTPQQRQVDIYHYDGASFEAYCHTRQTCCRFRVDRVLEARPTMIGYAVPREAVATPTLLEA